VNLDIGEKACRQGPDAARVDAARCVALFAAPSQTGWDAFICSHMRPLEREIRSPCGQARTV
jgi:hypothetical protein